MIDAMFAWLILPLGFALGWAVRARRQSPPARTTTTEEPVSVNNLLTQLQSDDSDNALAVLADAGSGDAHLMELQITLGRMFRKRGEVDRALRLHDALLARAGLPDAVAAEVQYELAQDYMAAGVMDRAEQLFHELAERGHFAVEALASIRTIHEQAHDWQHAIESARRLESAQGKSESAAIAQYYCELADEARVSAQVDEARSLAKQALGVHHTCVRAHLFLGALHEEADDFAAAARDYLRAFEYDPRFLPEVIEPLQRCFEKTGDRSGYLQFLHDAREISVSSLPFVAEARLLAEQGVDPLERLSEGLQKRPSRAVLAEFLEVLEEQPQVIASGLDKPAASLRAALLRLMETTPRYQCNHCGFNPRQMFWQCPACKQWGTIAPTDDVMQT